MSQTTAAKPAPTEQEIRDALNKRAEDYCAITGSSLSGLGHMIRGDKQLFFGLRRGDRNITLRLYGELMAWFDANWPAAGSMA